MIAKNNKSRSKNNLSPIVLSIALVAITVALFWPVRNCDFVSFDDLSYVCQNTLVTGGLTFEAFKAAFHFSHANWHPLTWLSHALDCQLFGLNPAAHHLTNLFFHAASALVLFFLLQRLTKATWRSALVAALFAWHPLRVESVAWVAERKDVLSAFFGLLALWTYVCYAQKSEVRSQKLESGRRSFPFCLLTSKFYLLSLAFFSLSLMSKPMLVTLPFVLLLLDFWPLQRLRFDFSSQPATPAAQLTTHHSQLITFLEKAPFLALSIASCFVTFLAQQHAEAVVSLQLMPLSVRLANASLSVVRYIGKIFWPVDLAVFYPFHSWSAPAVIAASALLLALSALVLWQSRRRPWLFVGWFWFLGALVPVIGIVQVGAQAMADRYSYWPSIGFSLAAVWTVAEWLARRRSLQLVATLLLLLLLGQCAWMTRAQIDRWRNTESLFQHALKVTTDNYVAYNCLGDAAAAAGKPEEAAACYRASLQANENAEAHHNLGDILLAQGKLDQAVSEFQAALRIAPGLSASHNSLGNALVALGRLEEAASSYRQALRFNPDLAIAHYNLAMTLEDQKKQAEAFLEYAEAERLGFSSDMFWFNFGNLLNAQGKFADAEARLRKAVALKPDFDQAQFQLALSLDRQKKHAEAVVSYEKMLALMPEHPETLNNLALIYASTTNADLRSPKMAVLLATRACAAANYSNPRYLDTLAQAYSADHNSSSAILWEQKALELALKAQDKPLEEALRARLALHNQGGG